VASQFRQSVDEVALAAAVAHETARVQHHDPLRLWLAQFATDLQWPSRRAVARLRNWMRILELARDDEARGHGVEGADLAAAILTAFRLRAPGSAVPTLLGERVDFETRIRRLLALVPHDDSEPPSVMTWLITTPALLAVGVLGALDGERLVRTAFSILP
jgi:hypothetical protein